MEVTVETTRSIERSIEQMHQEARGAHDDAYERGMLRAVDILREHVPEAGERDADVVEAALWGLLRPQDREAILLRIISTLRPALADACKRDGAGHTLQAFQVERRRSGRGLGLDEARDDEPRGGG